jgi:hypothetical protein
LREGEPRLFFTNQLLIRTGGEHRLGEGSGEGHPRMIHIYRGIRYALKRSKRNEKADGTGIDSRSQLGSQTSGFVLTPP